MRTACEVLTKAAGDDVVARVLTARPSNKPTMRSTAFARPWASLSECFVEHAIGRGEATRQRFARSGDALTYVGADLEDAAIDAALAEQVKKVLPASMIFVRQADIGRPDVLLTALRVRGIDPHGAVMLVGNGFHEVRGQTDEAMVDIFCGYYDAGNRDPGFRGKCAID